MSKKAGTGVSEGSDNQIEVKFDPTPMGASHGGSAARLGRSLALRCSGLPRGRSACCRVLLHAFEKKSRSPRAPEPETAPVLPQLSAFSPSHQLLRISRKVSDGRPFLRL